MRAMSFDIPLEMLCSFPDFVKALEDRTLPGGVRYNVRMAGVRASITGINRIMEEVRAYRTTSLAGRPKR
jgi:hypothetical protein